MTGELLNLNYFIHIFSSIFNHLISSFFPFLHSGGVYPPAAAFAKTSLIEELMKNDAKFEVISTLTDPGQKA